MRAAKSAPLCRLCSSLFKGPAEVKGEGDKRQPC